MSKLASRMTVGFVGLLAGLLSVAGCVTEEPGSVEAADTDCTGAALDDGGYCRMPNGHFASSTCCDEHPTADLDGKIVAYTLLETELVNVCLVEVKPDDAARVGLVEWGNDIPECQYLGPYMNDGSIGSYVYLPRASMEPVTDADLNDLQAYSPDQAFYWVSGEVTLVE